MSLAALKSTLGQTFPGSPKFTEKDIPNLTGKVCIVTGSNTGVGKETARMLYSKNANVYLAARSEEKTRQAIESIKASAPADSKGHLSFLRLDLADLSTIKSSAQEFLAKERELHLLINNAGVGYPEQGSKTKQGYELQLGVNCVGPFLFTKLLTPILASTAKQSPPDSVRVVWVSSSASEGISPKGFMDNLDYHNDKSSFHKYCISKIGNYFQATEFALRHKKDGVVSIAMNPGNLDSDFWRTQGSIMSFVLRRTVLHPPVYGAYTEIYSAFSPDITMAKTGSFVAPWGRLWQLSPDVTKAAKRESEGGTGSATKFWDWCEEQVRSYA
ncbi:hypothetical protein B0T10DRAFT_439864 [Thelonectria olida]|uniref:Short-chain dehydrogenase n=1 Tax=Thelonectria olida TaxID=1576542 RepID=A0A9P8W4W8_9HYPO|nr:hypothetical protein B0T10DRAFT_439864 [Thelonectria olida]